VRLEYKYTSSSVAAEESALLKTISDYYRYPKTLFDIHVSRDLSAEPGYFQFGPEAICYGRVAGNVDLSTHGSIPRDLLHSASVKNSSVVLPFDPHEVIENLRLERYPRGHMGRYENVLKSIYYRLRPFMNRTMRVGVQKVRAANWEKRSFPQWPVDTTVDNIHERLLLLALEASGIDKLPFIWFWPDGARGCVSMTHDVETAAGRDFCTQLMDIDDSFDLRSSFQVVPTERYQVTSKYLNSIRARGFEICVQDLNHDGRLFDNREEFVRRVSMINYYGRQFGASGFRSAILYRNLDWYQDLDFSFDMTVPNVAPLDPQRGGCCTVMPYFIGDVLEIPLTTVQDYTLFHLLNERSIKLWKIQLDKILSKNGLASFLVHPDYIIEPETQAVYRELLAELKEMRRSHALWAALPGDINRWWRARNQMSLVKDGKSWHITGEGSEHAVLAFAKNVNGQLVYELMDTPQSNRRMPKVKSIC
jgi:hypothetical protein